LRPPIGQVRRGLETCDPPFCLDVPRRREPHSIAR
jgi:hypothetical protein